MVWYDDENDGDGEMMMMVMDDDAKKMLVWLAGARRSESVNAPK